MGLEKLLYLQGVGAEFIDCFGYNIHICPEDRNGILKSMCITKRIKNLQQKSLFTEMILACEILQLDIPDVGRNYIL